ncbi:MAG: UvrD-helicase domain-containing protein [Treponema sp.]|nr:UvrD-helicase domain-containing protein [Treponema sp.]
MKARVFCTTANAEFIGVIIMTVHECIENLFLKDENVVLVFPTDIAAKKWADWTVLNTKTKSVAMERFIAWDNFKGECIRAKKENRQSVPALMRKVFAAWIIEKNKNEGGSVFKSLIKKDFTDSSASFSDWISQILPSLGTWKKYHDNADYNNAISQKFGSGSEELFAEQDYKTLYDEYKSFLEKFGYFDPAWEEPPFEPNGKTYCIIYPQILEDYGEYRLILEDAEKSGFVRLIPVPSCDKDFFVDFEKNSRSELENVALYLRKKHDEGISWADIAISVPDMDSYGPYLDRELDLYEIPHTMRYSKPLSSYGAGALFSSIRECVEENFSFESIKNLLLNDDIPWLEKGNIQSLIMFGKQNNCLTSFGQTDIWEKSFESPKKRTEKSVENEKSSLQIFYGNLKNALSRFGAAKTCAELYSAYNNFKKKFINEKAFFAAKDADGTVQESEFEESNRILARCVTELKNLVELEKKLAEDKNKTYSVVSPFSFWLSDLDGTAYLSQGESAALQVYPYRAACAAPFALHVLVDATQNSLSVSTKPLSFLNEEKRDIIKKIDRSFMDIDTGKLFIQLYKVNSKEKALFSGSEHSFAGYGFLHGAIESKDRELSSECMAKNLFQDEKDWFLEKTTCAPEKVFAKSASGFKKWFSLSNGATNDSDKSFSEQLSAVLKEKFFDEKRGAYKISATTLNSFYSCPRRWLFNTVLQLKPVENETELKDEFINGTVKHKILENYFAHFKEKNLPISDTTDEEVLRTALNSALCSFKEKSDWRTEISFMTGEFLFSEADSLFDELNESIGNFSAVFAGYKVYGTEVELESSPEAVELKDKNYYFVGAVDLILVREENVSGKPGDMTKLYTIIDYKNSKKSIPSVHYVQDKESNENIDFQIPMYVYLCDSSTGESIQVEDAGFFSIKDGDVRPQEKRVFAPIKLSARRTDGKITDTTMQEFLQKADEFFEKGLKNLDFSVTNLFQGYSVCAGSSRCVDFRPICRRYFTVSGDESVVRAGSSFARTVSKNPTVNESEKKTADSGSGGAKVKPAGGKRSLDKNQSEAQNEMKNVVVSAGAGSGKTTVLSSRFVKIVQDGTGLERILTLTFTNKVANEMKSRIFSALKKSGIDTSDFDKAHIQTLDSYFSEIARAGAHFYGITPSFTMDAEAIEKKINLESLRFLLEKRDIPEFRNAIKELTKVSDFQSLAENLLAYPMIHYDNLSDPIDFKKSLEIQVNEIEALFRKNAELATKAIRQMLAVYEANAGDYDSGGKSKSANLIEFARIMSENKVPELTPETDAHDFIQEVSAFLKIKKPASNWKGQLYLNYKEPLNQLYDCFAFFIYYENFTNGYGTQEKAVELLCEFQTKINDYKRKSGLLTFNDVACLARKTLVEHAEIRHVEQNKFSKIMIDEFQDDNQLQCDVLFMLADEKENERYDSDGRYLIPTFDEIKNRLSPEKLFFVGDEKQSIYSFRGADVCVFNKLKETLGLHKMLNTNYRSEKSLIDAFNGIFGGTGIGSPSVFMTNHIKENLKTRFSEEETLELLQNEPSYEYVGSDPEKAASQEPLVKVVMFNAAESEEEGEAGEEKKISENDDISEEKANSYEAEWIAGEINRLVGSEYTDKSGAVHRYKYSDFCLLFRTSSPLHAFERKLLAAGIPYSTEIYKGFFTDGPINDLVSYLKICVYPEDSNAYAKVLCSPFVNLSVSEMEKIISVSKVPFDFSRMRDGIISDESMARLRKAAVDFAETKRLLHCEKLTKTLSHLWYDLGYRYETLWNQEVSMYAGLYDILFEIARKSEENVQCLARFLDEVETYKDEAEKLDGLDIPLNESDSVKIMTIHKSKGLEFKVVFVCAVSNPAKANKSDNQNVSYDEKRNIMIKTVESEETKALRLAPASDYSVKRTADANFFIDEYASDNMKKSCAELRRVAYVAFTRAERLLYIVGNYKGELKGPSAGGGKSMPVECFKPGIIGETFTLGDKDYEYAPAKTIYQLMLPLIDYYTVTDGDGNRVAKADSPFSFIEFKKETFEKNQAERKKARLDGETAVARMNDSAAKKRLLEEAGAVFGNAEIVLAENVPEIYMSPSKLKTPVQNLEGDESYPEITDIVNRSGGRFSYNDFGSIAHAFLEARMKGLEPEINARFLVGLDNDDKKIQEVYSVANKMADDFEKTELFKSVSEAREKYGWLKAEYDFKYFSRDYSEHGVIFNGQIDLVVKTGEKKYLVVDYKTDQNICPEEHFGQIECYRSAICEMMGIEPENVECVLYYLRHRKAVKV